MNPTLLAREALAERGSLDPKPEPPEFFVGPTRLLRVVDERGEVWIDARTGSLMTEVPELMPIYVECSSGKVPHETRQSATKAAVEINSKTPLYGSDKPSEPYWCRLCSQWHIGRSQE